ncbi:hypothetical protein KM427_08740 [Nocardioides sp. LMS-CY]|uniref:hypothetical protein n=1 Tax=Nocardioides sp. (strain LMS-CY) TaxID=2840457 RepID=UPI001C000D6C|nr:hypothetical protein [Nocardioides sp. LMS-CY]QWF23759.1 hypothetical protein KM427_08740 [Nocardioides sp. LMS-CY]
MGRANDHLTGSTRCPQVRRSRDSSTLLDLRGRFLAIPDLFDPVRGVVGEHAGADHRDIDRHARDIEREADLRNAGLEYVETVGRDLRDERRVVHRMEQAAARAVHLERGLAPP